MKKNPAAHHAPGLKSGSGADHHLPKARPKGGLGRGHAISNLRSPPKAGLCMRRSPPDPDFSPGSPGPWRSGSRGLWHPAVGAFAVILLLLPALALAQGHQAAPELLRPPPDGTVEDDRLPEGTIQVSLRDPGDKPLPGVAVTLGVIQNSVAKGENRKHFSQTTNGEGLASFVGLEKGSAVAYRVSVAKDGGTFAATPFQMRDKGGMRVILHVYPVAHDIKDAVVYMQGAIFVDVKDDRVQIQQAFRVSNAGAVAWVPETVSVSLPDGYSAFNSSQQMSDQGWDSTPKGARLHGTFGAGESDVGYSWQLPYGGEKDVSFEVTLPPHMASLVVRAAASGQVKLEVDGFPAAEPDQDEEGNRLLVTGRQAKADDTPITRAKITIHGLPTAGPGRWIATSLAAFGIALGVAFATQRREKKRPKQGKGERAGWLLELEQLERARADGEVGPKTYERARREIIDGLARTLAKRSPAS
jgi:hypothetical protein